ncbi:MAG: pyroglutamyl-peptidase I [Clostridia bacterium]
MQLLVTGFLPFGGQCINPSWEAVRALPEKIGACTILRAALPVDWTEGPKQLLALLEAYHPAQVLCCGQAGGRAKICLERVAINLCESTAPDTAGVVRWREPIVQEGPAAYFSTLDDMQMMQALADAGIPAMRSYSAGAYLCNAVMYIALHAAQTRFPGLRAGFLHVPYLPEQGAVNMPADQQRIAVEQCVRVMAHTHLQGVSV